jgi:two-component system sensor histidine kinase UhpB
LTKVWNRLSLRQQLLLPIAAMIVGALLSGLLALQIFSPDQFEYENEQEAGSAQAVAAALTASLAIAGNPQESLNAFAGKLGTSEAIKYLPSNAGALPLARVQSKGVPAWFSSHLTIPELSKIYPITVGTAHLGNIAFVPDLSADIWEKWMGFLAIVSSSSIPMLLAAFSAYLTAGSALRPLGNLGAGLTRIREGEYDTVIPLTGPPEIRKSCQEANDLATTLKRLSHDNRELLRRLVSLQDDERRELARELHDEMGPLLFAIRANATALSEAAADDSCDLGLPAQGLFSAAEALQQANHRILERLNPLYLQDLGLVRSIESLLRNAQTQAPYLRLASEIDRALDGLDGLLSQTVYRVIQEGVTNALRHAQATAVDVAATIEGGRIAIEVSDDGIGLPGDMRVGRGLTGMSERVRALDGFLELVRERDRTIIRCRLPMKPRS